MKDAVILAELQRRNANALSEFGSIQKETNDLLRQILSERGNGSALTEQKGMSVQTLIFSKGAFKTAAEAKKWATEHQFDASKIDETDDSFRIRQKEPSRFRDGTFRTVQLTDGVKAVMGKVSEAITLDTAPWHVKGMPPEVSSVWIDAFNTSWKAHEELDDRPRVMQAEMDAERLVRDAGWVQGPGGWMKEAAGSVREAEWDGAYISNLPDSAFAFIEAGGEKDSDGRTAPRSLRHLPHHKKDGSIDMPHLRNALSRLPQTKMADAAKRKAMAHLKSHADDAGIGESARGTGPTFDIGYTCSVAEAKFDGSKGEVIAVLIEAGTNHEKRRHYPKDVVENAAAEFSGLKMYVNHPTSREDMERPERNLKDWAATVVESWPDDGKAMARIHVHDKWLRELLEDPVARKNIGLSINCKGQFRNGQIDGQPMQIVEKIIVERGPRMSSVDWVTEPGARGRVVQVFESRGGDLAMLETATLKDIQENRPDLLQAHEAEVREKLQKEGHMEATEVIKKAEEAGRAAAKDEFSKLQEGARKELIERGNREEKLKVLIKEVSSKPESLLPEVARQKILKNLVERQFADESAMKSAVESAVKDELQYLKTVGSARINTGGTVGTETGGKGLTESMQGQLEKRFGLTEVKKEEE